MCNSNELLSGKIINSKPVDHAVSLVNLIVQSFISYNAGRIREACHVVVAYLDSTIALPIVTAYALNQCTSRSQKRLYMKREKVRELLQRDYLENE